MNMFQFLSPQLRITLGSGGRIEGKKNTKLGTLLKVNTKAHVMKEEKTKKNNKYFQRILLSVLAEIFDVQNSKPQNSPLILQASKKISLSEDKVHEIFNALNNLKTEKTNDLDKVFKYLELVISSLSISNDDIEEPLLENTELFHKIFKNISNEDQEKVLKIMLHYLKNDADMLSKEKVKKLLNEISKILKVNNKSTNTSPQIPRSNTKDTLKILKDSNEAKDDDRFSMIENNKSKGFEQSINLENNVENPESISTTQEKDEETLNLRQEKILRNAEGNLSQSSSNIDADVKSLSTTKNVKMKIKDVSMISSVRAGADTKNHSSVKALYRKVGTMPSVSETSVKVQKFPKISSDFKFKVVSFERIKVSPNLKLTGAENFSKTLQIEKNIDSSVINKRLRITFAQKKYLPLRTNNFSNNKEFLALLSREREESVNIKKNGIALEKSEKNVEVVKKHPIRVNNDRSGSNSKSASGDKTSTSQFKDPIGYVPRNGSKVVKVDGEFSREISNIIEKSIQRNQGISNVSKPQVEIQRIVVKLHPPELGELELTVVKNGKNIEINMGVSSEFVKDTIEKNLNHLDQRLKELGFNLEKLNFEIKDQSIRTSENQAEDNQNHGKNYQEPQQQNHNNRRQNEYSQNWEDSTELFDEIFEKEVIAGVEQRI